MHFSGHQKIVLNFQFEYTNYWGFFWGMVRIDKNHFVPEKWSRINKLMTTAFSRREELPWWPWYSALPDQFFEHAELENWGENALPWWMIQEGTLVPIIVEVARSVHEVFKNEMALLE